MNIEVKLPQLDELELGGNTANDIELVIKTLLAIDRKLDALTLAIASPGAMQLDLPLTDKPKADEPAPKRKGRRKVELIDTTSVATSVISGNGEDVEDQDDEDAQRAHASFEAKRVQRVFGVGAMRAAIKKVAGANILNVDDVPAWQLPELLAELQAM